MSHRLITAAAVSLLALGAAACGGSTDANEPPNGSPDAACLVGDESCFETGFDPASGACLEGDLGCFETGAEPGVGVNAGMCAPDSIDCLDTDATADRCLAEAVDCVDTPGGVEEPESHAG